MIRVLIVDDHEENLLYLQALLADHDCAVDLARHGAEALVIARKTPPDVVIADLLMPVMDGYTLLRHWKGDTRLREVPFIVYTATYTEPADEELALRLGADAFILKPSEPEDFLARLREVQANAAAAVHVPPHQPIGDEVVLLKNYNEALIRKLEDKMLQLEETNRALEQDIVERKLAQATAAHFAAIVKSSDDAIVGKDLRGIVTSWNAGAQKVFGYSASEMIGQSIVRLIPPDRVEEEEHVLGRIREGKSVEHYETVRVTKDGRMIDISLTVSPIENDAGEIVGASKVARDITALKRTQDALRASEARFRQLLASNIVGVVFWNLQGDLLEANDLLLRMFGYTREDLRQGNLNCQKLTPPEYTAVGETAFAEMAASGSCNPFEKECIRKDGSRISVLVGSALLEGQQEAGSSFIMDITEWKKAESEREHYASSLKVLSRRLFEMQEEERRHLARELHDQIGQTLTAAKLNLKIIAPEVPSTAAGRIEDSMQLLDGLLQQVRQLALDLRPPALDELGLVPALRWLADQQGQRAQLGVTFTAKVDDLKIDPAIQTACFRVAQEAFTNTIRHARARSVAVELRHEADRLWLSVRDDGAGFDPAAISQRGTQHPRLGVLSMKERAALLGGGLAVHSAPGRGTEIRAWFPLAPAAPDATALNA